MSEAFDPFANVKIVTKPKKEVAVPLSVSVAEAEQSAHSFADHDTDQLTVPDQGGRAVGMAVGSASTMTPKNVQSAVKNTAHTPPVRSKRMSENTIARIKENALAEGYRSDSAPAKETTKTFAYTFYPSDVRAARRIKMAIMEEELNLNISDSEVMRAGVAALKALSYEEQKRLVLAQKKR